MKGNPAGLLLTWASTREGKRFAALLAVALILRLILAPFPGFFDDPQYYVDWGLLLPRHFWDFYSAGAREALLPPNYPPLTIYLFALLDALYLAAAHALHLSPAIQVAHAPFFALTTKLPAIGADLGITLVAYVLACKRLSPNMALVVAACFAFSPPVILDSALWGQTDSLFVLAVLAALLLTACRRSFTAGMLCAVAIMLKPQPVIFVPLIVFYLWRWAGWRAALRGLSGLCTGVLVLALPYLLPPWPEVLAFYTNFASITAKWPGATVTAFNLWWLLGAAGHPYNAPWLGPLSPDVLGILLFLATFAVVCAGIWRDATSSRLFLAAALLTVAFFDVTALQHERYLYPAVLFFLVSALSDQRAWLLYAISSLTLLLNMVLIIVLFSAMSHPGIDVHNIRTWTLQHPEITVAIAATNLALLVTCIVIYTRRPAQMRTTLPPPPDTVRTGDAEVEVTSSPSYP
jgi:dolichyl-phosphate-mannose-protein mannosyltransferase